MIATVLVAASLALPQGFTEAKVLESAASYVAGKPVRVYCAPTDLDLREYVQRSYGGPLGGEVGLAEIPDGVAVLGQTACDPLRDRLRRRPVATASLAESVLALTHEAVHLRGVRDEGQTECAAMHTMPGVAVRYFHVKPGKQLRGLMSDAWSVHRAKSPAYTAVC